MYCKLDKTRESSEKGTHSENLNFKAEPAIDKTNTKRLYECNWNIGDVFAFQLESDLAKEKNIQNQYFLIQKVDEDTWHPGHVVPIVYIKVTENGTLPSNEDEYDRLEYVQTWFTKYKDRFFPIDGKSPQNDILKKSKMVYEVNDAGVLPQFRCILVCTSNRSVPKKLIYVGNFLNVNPPEKEFIPHDKTNLPAVSWKDFEGQLIKRYFGYNRREYKLRCE